MVKMTEKQIMDILEDELVSKLEMDAEGQWDSLDYVTIIQRLDTEFDGKVEEVPEQELATMTTPRKIINLLREKKIIE